MASKLDNWLTTGAIGIKWRRRGFGEKSAKSSFLYYYFLFTFKITSISNACDQENPYFDHSRENEPKTHKYHVFYYIL